MFLFCDVLSGVEYNLITLFMKIYLIPPANRTLKG